MTYKDCPRGMVLLAAIAICLPFSTAPANAQEVEAQHLAEARPPPPSQSDSEPRPTDGGEQEHVTGTPSTDHAAGHSPSFGRETARMTSDAALRYAKISAAGGWPRVKEPIGPRSKGAAVVALRRRLATEGYLSGDEANGPAWDDGLSEAVKRFQSNAGLSETGIVSHETLRELNVPAASRAHQLEATAKRLLQQNFRFSERYVDVNVPAATVEAVEGDEIQKSYTAIVGGRRHPSPQITAKIVSVDINPTWTVPASIIKKELVPSLRRNPSYLLREHIRVLDGRGHEIDPMRLRRLSAARAANFTFRQDPGPKNSLGSLRISMPNKEEVYMHDTPNKELFNRDYRFLSHGCVRVEGVYDLASWLLKGPGGAPSGQWDEAALRQRVDEGRSEKIKLRRSVPVVWVYLTGWASPDGVAHFRRDIYGLDKGAKVTIPTPVSRSGSRRR